MKSRKWCHLFCGKLSTLLPPSLFSRWAPAATHRPVRWAGGRWDGIFNRILWKVFAGFTLSLLEWGRLSGTAPNEHAFNRNVVKLVRPPNRQPAFCREKWCWFSATRPAHLQSWLEAFWLLWVHFPAQIKALIKAECKEQCRFCWAVLSGFIWFCLYGSVSAPLNHLHTGMDSMTLTVMDVWMDGYSQTFT